MTQDKDIRDVLSRYLGGELSLDEFQEMFVSLSVAKESDLSDVVDTLLVRVSVEEITEDELQEALHDLVGVGRVRVAIHVQDALSTTLSETLRRSASVRADTQDEAVSA